jgi:NAD(P)-dependent dehydrogenase (short-subunit alcohol dehydrogenase family)
MVDLPDAKILVTGGARRLGAAIAHDLAAVGAHVCVTYRSAPPDASLAAAGIQAVHADLADPAQAVAAVEEAARLLSGLDGVVHAASGGFRGVPLQEVTPELFEEAIGATLRGGLFVAQAAGRLVSDGGAIVFIGDIAGIAGWPSFLPHSAAKGALRPLVRGLARSLGPRIRVSIVQPGTVLLPEGSEGDELTRAIPLQRVGEPSDVAGAVRYLLTAPYVTGAELVVDGGRLVV